MSKSVLQNNNNQDNQRITITVPKELIDEVRGNTKNISKFFNDAVRDKIKNERNAEFIKSLKDFKRVSINEDTLDILRRDRNE